MSFSFENTMEEGGDAIYFIKDLRYCKYRSKICSIILLAVSIPVILQIYDSQHKHI